MRLIAPLLALALSLAPLSGLAQPKIIPAQIASEEAQDHAVVRKAMQAGSFKGMAAFEKDLIAVLDHAPAQYPQMERKGDVTTIRLMMGKAGKGTSILAGAVAAQNRTTAIGLNTYPMAALLLGSLANERRDYRRAIAYLDRGLTLQPDNVTLMIERGAAMGQLRQFSDALALYERAEKLDFVTRDINLGDEARLMRAKGFVLIELKRLDEAEAAYGAALKLEPGHAQATAELDYIRKLRAGGPQAEIGLIPGTPPPQASAPAKP
jgi:Flp pilus assembly protein TadD